MLLQVVVDLHVGAPSPALYHLPPRRHIAAVFVAIIYIITIIIVVVGGVTTALVVRDVHDEVARVEGSNDVERREDDLKVEMTVMFRE